jgi:hypothetical protein
MEVSEVRRRLRAAIEQARRQAAIRRERNDTAAREYQEFLTGRAVPVFNTLAAALTAEGHRFKVSTPADAVRLFAEFSQEDYIELGLDTSGDKAALVLRTNRGRGRRQISTERTVRDATAISTMTEEEVLESVLGEIEPFVER